MASFAGSGECFGVENKAVRPGEPMDLETPDSLKFRQYVLEWRFSRIFFAEKSSRLGRQSVQNLSASGISSELSAHQMARGCKGASALEQMSASCLWVYITGECRGGICPSTSGWFACGAEAQAYCVGRAGLPRVRGERTSRHGTMTATRVGR